MRRLRGSEIVAISYKESTEFFESLVHRLRERGVVCAITSGMACVALGLAHSTKDCDVLCSPDSADAFLEELERTNYEGVMCRYRGRTTPPFDVRWLRGGWSSHFEWRVEGWPLHLDVFGVPPRSTRAWTLETTGLYVGLDTLADMKRTDRQRDWPFVTGIGLLMLEGNDWRGWLHVYDQKLLVSLISKIECPDEAVAARPLLSLAKQGDARLAGALRAERDFWQQLDTIRLSVYSSTIKPYSKLLRQTVQDAKLSVLAEHPIRVQCAEEALPMKPLHDYGVDRIIDEAKDELKPIYSDGLLDWLPDVRSYFGDLL
jgi:hypothetical protein